MQQESEAVCLLCRDRISYKNRERKSFIRHLKHSHNVKYNLSYVLAVNFLGQESREIIVNKFEESSPVLKTDSSIQDIIIVKDKTSNLTHVEDESEDIMIVDNTNSWKVTLDLEGHNNEETEDIILEEVEDTENLSMEVENESSSKSDLIVNKIKSPFQTFSNIDTAGTIEKENNSLALEKCDICEKAVGIVSKLCNHAITHGMKKVKVAVSKETLTTNLRRLVVFTKKSSLNCEMCQKAAGTINKLKIHTKIHNIKDEHQKDFVEDSKPTEKKGKSLNSISVNEKNVETESKTSKQVNNKMVSDDENWFKCKECNMSFKQNKTFKLHRRRHMQKKPFSCEICLDTFKLRLQLNQHLKTHPDHKGTQISTDYDHKETQIFKKLNHPDYKNIQISKKVKNAIDCDRDDNTLKDQIAAVLGLLD